MFKYIITAVALLSSQAVLADMKQTFQNKGNVSSTLLFMVQSDVKGKQLPISICLDALAKKKVCQNYSAGISEVGIKAMNFGSENKNHPNAGIKIDASGYKITGCKPHANGYCLFAVSSKTPTVLKIS